MNPEQNLFVVATEEDGIYCNLYVKEEADLDDLFNIKIIKQCIYDVDDRTFYIVANKKQEKLGLYLVKFC